MEPNDEATSTFTLEEVAGIVEQSTREGVTTDTTVALSNAFEFTAKKVHDVEVPLSGIVALPPDSTPDILEELVGQVDDATSG